MDEKKAMSMEDARRIITRLQLAYGKAFGDKWQDVPLDALIADWAERLGKYAGDDEVIAYAMEHLPPAFPPTAMEFAELCENGASRRWWREREAAKREFAQLVTPDGMEWVAVWGDRAKGEYSAELRPIGSGLQRIAPPREVVQRAEAAMKGRLALVRL